MAVNPFNEYGKYLFLERYVLAELGQTKIKEWQRQVLLAKAGGRQVAFGVAATQQEKDAFFAAADSAIETWDRSQRLSEAYKGRGA